MNGRADDCHGAVTPANEHDTAALARLPLHADPITPSRSGGGGFRNSTIK